MILEEFSKPEVLRAACRDRYDHGYNNGAIWAAEMWSNR